MNTKASAGIEQATNVCVVAKPLEGGEVGNTSPHEPRRFNPFPALIVMALALAGCKDNGGSPCTHIDAATVASVYDDTAQCMNMNAPPPNSVEFQSFEHFGLPPAEGLYIPSTKQVWINGDLNLSCSEQTMVLKHEYVHHILRENGYVVESETHDFPRVWAECGAIILE